MSSKEEEQQLKKIKSISTPKANGYTPQATTSESQISDGEVNPNVKPFKAGTDTAAAEETPVQHGFEPDPNKPIRYEIKKKAFLDAYNKFITPAHTCQALMIPLPTFYGWLDRDPEFNRAFQFVERHLTDRMIRVAAARAIRGSDNLLMFMLRARDNRFHQKLQAEVDPQQIEAIVRDIVDSLRKTVPNSCPHCKKELRLSEKVEEMLIELSKGKSA